MPQSVLFPIRYLARRRLAFAVLAAWGVTACAQSGNSVTPPPLIAENVAPPRASAATSLETSAVAAGAVPATADPLAELIQSATTLTTVAQAAAPQADANPDFVGCLLYTSPSPRDCS
nr:hypothetical protein [uncultured Cupriavidus sp.]